MKYILGLILISGAFIYLVWLSFSASFQYALMPAEFIAKEAEYVGKSVKISGTVEAGSIVFSGSDYKFNITDGTKSLPVHYYKISVPNTFREGADVVVSGQFKDGIFEAKDLLTKCASKYVPK